MNVNPLNEAILSSAESIFRTGYRLVCDIGGRRDAGEQEAAWAYMHDSLLPIHVVWQAPVAYRKALRRYATELVENATAIAGHDETPPELTFTKFDELLVSLFGQFHSFVPAEKKLGAFHTLAVVSSTLARREAAQLSREHFPAAVAVLLSRDSSGSGYADSSVEESVTCTHFNCVALLAHLLNEKVVARMQSAAKAGPS